MIKKLIIISLFLFQTTHIIVERYHSRYSVTLYTFCFYNVILATLTLRTSSL